MSRRLHLRVMESWGECSTSCGMGSRFRTRVKKEELYGGEREGARCELSFQVFVSALKLMV